MSHDDDESTEFAELDRVDVLRTQLASARRDDDGSPKLRRVHVDATRRWIVALVEELDDDRADAELAGLWPLVAHDPLLEIETRRGLARELIEVGDHERAIAILDDAAAAARARRMPQLVDEIAIALEVARSDRARRLPAADPREIDDEELAREAVEHARQSADIARLHEATCALAELLAAREAFEEAEELLEALPPLDDARETRALLEEIWRRLGAHLVDRPDEPDERTDMDRQLRAYITKPRNFSQALSDGGLASRDRIREWSYGELRAPADLESQRIFGPVRSFWCACGRYRGRTYAGLVCKRCGVELVHNASRRTRSGHITLKAPVVHPWYAPAAAMLLGAQDIDARPVETLRDQLRDIDLEWLADEVKRDIITAPKAKIADAAGRRLALIEGFRNARKSAYTRPEDIVLDIVAVVPPHGDLGCDREQVRDAYAQLLEADAGATPAAVRRLFEAFGGAR